MAIFESFNWEQVYNFFTLFFLTLIFTVLYVSTLWYSYKIKTTSKQKKTDPLFKALLFTLAVLAIVVVLELTGLFDRGMTKKLIPYYPLIFVAVFGMYYYVGRTAKPWSREDLIGTALWTAEVEYGATPYRGDAYAPWKRLYKESYDSSGKSIVANIILFLKGKDDVLREYLYRLNAYTGRIIFDMEGPPVVEIHRLTGEKLATVTEVGVAKAFDDYVDENRVEVTDQGTTNN